MRAETLDLNFRSLDHRFELGDEFLVHRVVGGAESVQGGCAGPVENPELARCLCVSGAINLRVPIKRLFATCLRIAFGCAAPLCARSLEA